MERCECWNFANDSDIVTIIPPDRATLQGVMNFLGAPYLVVWDDWERPPQVRIMDGNGNVTPGPPPAMDFSVLIAIVIDVLNAETLSPVQGHSITTYINRIETRCNEPEWPIDAEMIEDWPVPPPEGPHPDYVILMEDGANVLQEHGPPILVEDQ